MKFFLIITLLLGGKNLLAHDSTSFSCKYRYTWQQDSANAFSKFNDIMILTISNSSSIYYSYLKQFGNRNMEQNIINSTGKYSNGNVTIDAGSEDHGKYFLLNEAEIIETDFAKKQIKITDQLMETSYAYGYRDTLIVPKWNIAFATSNILGQNCQMATTSYKGRNYTAWFAPSIPISMGPWLFNGLPGLILKVSDDKQQFVFECIELNSPLITTKVFKAYSNIKNIDKKKLQAKKKLMVQDPIGFMEAEDGVTITVSGGNGTPVKRPNKPYNPIDLTQ